jgi:hypothetical protein
VFGNVCLGDFQCCAYTHSPSSGLCINIQISTSNCGACGHLCPFPARCDEGFCIPPAEYSFCGCAWADLSSDPDHCGGCGIACPDGVACESGSCLETEDACTGDEALCGDGCRSLTTIQHCESCEIKCISVSGEDYTTDCSRHCGECSRRYGHVGPDVIGWNSSAVTDVCSNPDDIVWLGNQCLTDCPTGYLRTDEPDLEGRPTVCVPYNFDESGNLYIFVDMIPRCGSPDTSCGGSGSACIGGTCTCMTGYTPCAYPETDPSYPGTYCTDTSSDPFSCGSCWNRCSGGLSCIDGVCT